MSCPALSILNSLLFPGKTNRAGFSPGEGKDSHIKRTRVLVIPFGGLFSLKKSALRAFFLFIYSQFFMDTIQGEQAAMRLALY